MDSDRTYLQHMRDAMEKIERYVNGMTLTSFIEDEMRIDAVVRCLEIIGEAANNMTEGFRDVHPEIPWGYIRGMRNHIVHEYFGVDVAVVWQTVQDDLPKLSVQLQQITS